MRLMHSDRGISQRPPSQVGDNGYKFRTTEGEITLSDRLKGASMKKVKSSLDELRAEYKRSDFKKLERGKYCERVRANSNVVVLDSEVAAAFPNSAAVNKALHSLLEVAWRLSGPATASTRPARLRRFSGELGR
jgi:hypothetical protein